MDENQTQREDVRAAVIKLFPNLTPAQVEEKVNEVMPKQEETKVIGTAVDLARKTIDTGFRALDWGDGQVRNKLFNMLGGSREGDDDRAMKGDAPSYEEVFERENVDWPRMAKLVPGVTSRLYTDNVSKLKYEPGGIKTVGATLYERGAFPSYQGTKDSLGGKEPGLSVRMLDPKASDVVAKALDLGVGQASTYLPVVGLPLRAARLAAKIPKVGKSIAPWVGMGANIVAGNPFGKVLEKPGEYLHGTGFKGANVDALEAKKKDGSLEKTMRDLDIRGSSRQMFNQMLEQIKKLTGQRDEILTKVSDSGLRTNPKTLLSSGKDNQLMSMIDELANSSQHKEIADEMRAIVEIHHSRPLDALQSAKEKTYAADKVSPDARNAARDATLWDRFYKLLAKGHDDSVRELISRYDEILNGLRVTPELAPSPFGARPKKNTIEQYGELNNDLANLLTARDAMLGEAKKEGRKDIFTAVDGLALGADPAVFATKKIADLSKLPWLRTKGGYGLMRAGKNPVIGQLLDQGALEAYRRNPWTLMPKRENNQ